MAEIRDIKAALLTSLSGDLVICGIKGTRNGEYFGVKGEAAVKNGDRGAANREAIADAVRKVLDLANG